MEDIETVGLGIHWEDLPVGRKFKTVGRTVTEADLVNFISCTGMLEVLFTNTEFLEKESAIKGRVVPGALVYTFAEGLLVQSVMQGVGLAFLNMELDIKAPTFVGDTIHVRCEVIESQESRKRPGLVLQPEFMAMRSPPPMAAAGALLVAPAPHRPGKDLCGRGWARPDQTPEQPAQFGHRVRQQLQPQSESDCGWRS